MRSKELFKRLKMGAFVLMAMLLQTGIMYGQEYDSIALKYKNEHAVVINHTMRMVISFENGKPAAKTYVTQEKLLISDLAPGIHNSDYFYHDSKFNVLEDFRAWTYTPGKSGYKKTSVYAWGDARYPDRSTFYQDSWARVVAFSGLSKGTRTEIKYTMEHEDAHMLPKFYLVEGVPIVKATFEVVAPKYVEMKFVLKGEHTDWFKQSKTEANGMVTYTFTANDVPAYKAYKGVPSMLYYTPHVVPYITSYKRYNEDKPHEWLASPDELYKHLYKHVSHINMVEDTGLNKIVKAITKNDQTDREKAAHIYKWVQNSMHYIAFEDGLEGFVPREAKLACNRKYGDCKDMASVLMAMCRKAGLNAYFAWIGTTYLPYTNEETPMPGVDNHMICALKLGDEWVFLDGTNPVVPFGVNRDDIQGKEAMIAIDANNYKIVTIPVVAADKNVTTDSTFITSIDGNKIQGSVKQSYKGYGAWEIHTYMSLLKNRDQEKYIKGLTERGSNKFTQTHHDLDMSDTVNKDVRLNADFYVEDYVNNAGKQYYVNMNVDRYLGDKHIDTKDRTVPYYFDYKEKKKEVVVLDIPKGYRVTYLPKNAKGSENGLWNYTITYKADKKRITLVKEYELNTVAVTQKQFAAHNKLVADLRKQYSESVVLTAN